MRRIHRHWLGLGLSAAIVGPARAQAPTDSTPRLITPAPMDPRLQPGAPDSANHYPRTYWVEGGVGGGLALGTLTGIFVAALCGMDETDPNCGLATAGGVLVGAGTGFVIGALIGGRVKKRPPEPGAPKPPSRVTRVILTSILTPVGVAIGASQDDGALWALVGGAVGFGTGQFVGHAFEHQGPQIGTNAVTR